LHFIISETPLARTYLLFTLFGLNALSDKLDRPFDDLDNTLPINSISNIIERDICAALGQPLPNLVAAIN